jgi:hypothetical protein
MFASCQFLCESGVGVAIMVSTTVVRFVIFRCSLYHFCEVLCVHHFFALCTFDQFVERYSVVRHVKFARSIDYCVDVCSKFVLTVLL